MDDKSEAPSKPQPRPAVRWRLIVWTLLLAPPAIYYISLSLPEEQPSRVNRSLEGARVDQSFDGDGPINVTREGIALKGKKVVAFHENESLVKGDEAFAAEYGGAVFHFVSAENRDRFLKAPEQYLPQFGGYCSLGVANGYKDDMHPEAFSVADGKLYFNLTPSIHRRWEAGRERYIQQAEANWPALRNAEGHGWGDAR